MSNTWSAQLIRAAKRRATVTLIDGKRGTLVFAPNPNRTSQRTRPPRHGDPTKCGVRLSDATPDWIAAVPSTDIIGIDPD